MALNDKEKFAKYQTALLILAKSCARLRKIAEDIKHSPVTNQQLLKEEVDKMEKVFNAIVKIEEMLHD